MSVLRTTLIVWGLLLVTSETGSCDADWFGSKCQYKCRCTDNKCDDNGICKDGSKCSTGWFGPACQYSDLAADSQINQTGSSVEYAELTDGDEKTCVDVSSFKSLTVDWTTPYPFTWMRIDLDRPDQNNVFQIQFKKKSHTDIILNCNNQKMFRASPTTIDIHCDLDVAVDQVIVSWKNVKSICSVYISGGRNVALKQNTSQSTTPYPPYSSSAAVNDELKWQSYKPGCTHTSWESSPHWNLYFTQPEVVNRYILYNRDICCKHRLQGFILESFADDGSLLLNHKDKQGVKDIYTVLSVGVKEPVSQVKITATDTTEMGGKSLLSLCEVQLYGDSQCPKGRYGLECNKTCNCAKDENCFVSTGGCPSGCAAGFYGDECRAECPTGYHGIDCLESCNNTCRNQSCDRVSGKCHGCVPGKQEDFCTNDCSERTYGQDCKDSYSEFCDGNGSCDPYNGTCTHGCKAGYQGVMCNETCGRGKYGKGCSSQCIWCQANLINDDSVCHHETGVCNYGCLPDYEDKCESDSTDESLELKIGIGVACAIIAILTILAVVLGIVLFRRKIICNSKTREDVRSQNYDDVVSGDQVEHPYEDMYRDADGYSIPHDHHRPGLKETVAYEIMKIQTLTKISLSRSNLKTVKMEESFLTRRFLKVNTLHFLQNHTQHQY